MVKLIDLIFISIPEAFAMSYFIWMLVGRSSYIDHKKIAITAITCATALNVSFESINSMTIKGIYQLLIIVAMYYLFYDYRLTEVIISCFTSSVLILVNQSLTIYFLNDVVNVNKYFTLDGYYLKELEIKIIMLVVETITFSTVIYICKLIGFVLTSKSNLKQSLINELVKFIIAVFSVIIFLIPELNLFYVNTVARIDYTYLAINTILYVCGIYYIAYSYMKQFLNTYKTNVIQEFQVNKLKSQIEEEDKLLETADNVVEITFGNNKKKGEQQ